MTEKRCSRCEQVKPLDDFARNRSRRDGHSSYCKVCHAVVVRENVKKNHGSGRSLQLKRRYGIDATQAEWLLLRQGGLCAVCLEGPPRHVDHDHATNVLRGLTCFNCNRGLGYFGDDLETMYRAADYLERA